MISSEDSATVRDISERRIQAFREASGQDYRKVIEPAMAEATTRDDIDFLGSLVQSLPDDVKFLVHTYHEVWMDFGRFRCSVCGRTRKQSDAINYDCTTGC